MPKITKGPSNAELISSLTRADNHEKNLVSFVADENGQQVSVFIEDLGREHGNPRGQRWVFTAFDITRGTFYSGNYDSETMTGNILKRN